MVVVVGRGRWWRAMVAVEGYILREMPYSRLKPRSHFEVICGMLTLSESSSARFIYCIRNTLA